MNLPIFRKAGEPALRIPTFAIFLLSATALAGCATTQKPPEISYDDAPAAVQTVDPPAPVQVVELPRPLPLPGQLQRVEPSRSTPEPADPTARVNQANAAARMQPVRNGFINSMQVYPRSTQVVQHGSGETGDLGRLSHSEQIKNA